ncbi:deoxyribodipyrimidine photo-lyase [Lobosporangium transversale]|uniref:Deoxyribodipyrimidine photo-lyase n=1 Tax=Lobosporangium transversale TaxID=64571 RepID=A0A1Y2GAA3_9FUNG|nr:deoxyribodipyrimidine photo-lyase [Lobosporangium transversale]ORZ04459.1 deoxyribodipyrimidine photo-lyase [Lobosporangium transversale]|eukprot:XP_021876567.1 deoxyribodipyrimidine photo-lyase [Lobosporangium transversale]
MWFRNDLRLRDNKALYAAAARAKLGSKKSVIGLFVISEKEWASHDEAPIKIDFWIRNLVVLKRSLEKLHIPLIVKKAATGSQVVELIESTVKGMDVSHVFWNVEYMVDEMRRDAAVLKALTKNPGIYVEQHDDQGVVPPKEMKNKIGEGHTSFESFRSTWNTLVETDPHYLQLLPVPEANPIEAKQLYAEYFNASVPPYHPHSLDMSEIEQLYPAGEDAAHERLRAFIENKIMRYHLTKDSLTEEDDTKLSPYLSNGVLSTRQCVAAARAANNNKIIVGNEGVRTWIKEIIWREFYRHVLVFYPRVCKNRAFKPPTDSIRWSSDDRKFQIWCQGKTGYPIIDAGMRQLNATGYMHSRIRMLVACFLVKDLLISWQKGEKYFMSHLIDGEFSFNNGSWQWCASTGAESQPYFRVFNPVVQSQKFDPVGDYIRHWVPELKGLSDKQVHDPYHAMSAKEFGKLTYPKPIVDHSEARKKFVEEYKRVLVQK